MPLPASGRPGRSGVTPFSSLAVLLVFCATLLPSWGHADLRFSLSNDLPALPVEPRPGIDYDRLELSHPVSVASYFPSASVSLRSQGTAGQLATLSVDGGLSAHTALTLDGAAVRSLQIMPMDAGMLPLEFVSAVDIFKANMAALGASGTAGTVNFSTDQPRSFLRLTLGSMREISIAGLAAGKNESGIWQAGLSGTLSSNLFPTRPDGSVPGNLDFGRYSALGSWRSPSMRLALTHTGRSAGVGSRYSGDGRQDDLYTLASLDWKTGGWEAGGEISWWYNHYSNTIFGTETHQNYGASAFTGYRLKESAWEAGWKLREQAGMIDSTRLGKRYGSTLDLSGEALYRLGAFTLAADADGLWDAERGVYPVGGCDAVYLPVEGVELSGGVSRLFRLPTANELYWPDDGYSAGNPALLPEEGWQWKAGLSVALPWSNLPPVTLRAGYRESRMGNLILWAPEGGKWTSKNTGTALSRSGDAALHWRDMAGGFLWQADASFAVNWTVNDNPASRYYGKRMLYVPLYKTAVSFSFERFREWGVTCFFRSESERFTTEENTSWLPAYFTLDATAWYGIFFVSAENLLDADYSASEGFPQPGRNFKAGVDWRF